jgi:cytochrome o ubiquinol oxidase operon protein cyoD
MSGHHDSAASGHEHHGHHDDHAHGSFKSYSIGFLLSVVLTAIPFWLVMSGKGFDKSSTTAIVILGLAAVQIVVHMIYFLHLNTKAEGGWNMLALIFTVVLVVITLSGRAAVRRNTTPPRADARSPRLQCWPFARHWRSPGWWRLAPGRCIACTGSMP